MSHNSKNKTSYQKTLTSLYNVGGLNKTYAFTFEHKLKNWKNNKDFTVYVRLFLMMYFLSNFTLKGLYFILFGLFFIYQNKADILAKKTLFQLEKMFSFKVFQLKIGNLTKLLVDPTVFNILPIDFEYNSVLLIFDF